MVQQTFPRHVCCWESWVPHPSLAALAAARWPRRWSSHPNWWPWMPCGSWDWIPTDWFPWWPKYKTIQKAWDFFSDDSWWLMMVEARLELMMVDVFVAPMGHERLIGVGHADMGISLMESQVATARWTRLVGGYGETIKWMIVGATTIRKNTNIIYIVYM